MVTGIAVMLGSPVLVIFDKSDVPAVARFAMCSMLVLFGIGTTAICYSYLDQDVSQCITWYDHSRNNATVLKESKGLMSGFGNFKVNNKPFYVHTEPQVFKDRVLLTKLLRQSVL